MTSGWRAVVEKLKDPRLLVKITLGSFLAGPLLLVLAYLVGSVCGEAAMRPFLYLLVVVVAHALFGAPFWWIAAIVRCLRLWPRGLWGLALAPLAWLGTTLFLAATLLQF